MRDWARLTANPPRTMSGLRRRGVRSAYSAAGRCAGSATIPAGRAPGRSDITCAAATCIPWSARGPVRDPILRDLLRLSRRMRADAGISRS
jgi:hypothetical protein